MKAAKGWDPGVRTCEIWGKGDRDRSRPEKERERQRQGQVGKHSQSNRTQAAQPIYFPSKELSFLDPMGLYYPIGQVFGVCGPKDGYLQPLVWGFGEVRRILSRTGEVGNLTSQSTLST